jgi:hypothetical protein
MWPDVHGPDHIPVPLKPEARAEGMRIATHESTRIPSARASGFPAKKHDGQRPPLQKKHPHAAARSRCMRSYPRALDSPRREPRECGSARMKRRGFPQLALRASRQRSTTVRDRRYRKSTRTQGRDRVACGRIPVPLKPEARAEGMRIATHESTRIPSARASGFTASGSTDSRRARRTSSRRRPHAPPHAAAEGRAACFHTLTAAAPRRPRPPGGRPHARRGAPRLPLRRAKPAGAMDGPAGVNEARPRRRELRRPAPQA